MNDAVFAALVDRHKSKIARAGHEVHDCDTPTIFEGRTDQQFIWVTLRQKRMIERASLFWWSDHVGVKYGALVQLGDALNGPPYHIHGGFSAALLDDLFAFVAVTERDSLGMPAAPLFTANLNVNYRRPVPHTASYYIELQTTSVEKGRKFFMKAKLYAADEDVALAVADGAVTPLVDATALYILVLPKL